MADTYEAFYNGKPLNPNRGLPTMTYAQAEDCGLTESERLWCRTDGEDSPVTADDIPYDSNNSVKDKIDEKAEAENYSNLAITNSRGGAETNKANLKACGNIGFCRFSFKCQNSSSEDLTVALPSGWYFCYGAYSMRDTTNGQLVTVWAQSNVLSTYLHTGTTTVGNSYTITVPCFKA